MELETYFRLLFFYGVLTLFIFNKTYRYVDAVSNVNYSKSIIGIFTDKKFLFYAGICVLCLGYIMTYLSLAPVLMIEVFKTTPLVFSIYFSINAVIISTVSFSLKKIIILYNARVCVAFGLLLITISALGLLILSKQLNMNLFWLLIALGSAGFAFSLGPSISFALSKHQEYSGIAAGFLGFIYLTFSPMLAFFILKISNTSIFFYGLCFFILSSLFLGLLIFQNDRKRK